MNKMTNEQYWMRRDCDEKMESLYGHPRGLPKEKNDLMPKPGIVQCLVFSSLLVGISTLSYLFFKSLY